jgi:sugar-specific transcriptional regulator TrmB
MLEARKNDEAISTLACLGLSVLQAKAYIALAMAGPSTARETAKIANIAPADIYRIVLDLQSYGLVEKVVSKPNKYIAMSLAKGTEMLLQRREKQTLELKKSIDKLISYNLNAAQQDYAMQKSNGFVIEPGEVLTEKKAHEFFEKAKVSLDLIGYIEHEEYFARYENGIRVKNRTLDRKVIIREILSKSPEYKIPKRLLLLQERKPNYQLRFVNFLPSSMVMIKDSEEVLMSTTNNRKWLQYPSLWSNNIALTRVVQEWYNNIWDKKERSKDCPNTNT